MRVLHWDFSEKYTEFLDWFHTVSSKRIVYRYIDEHPSPAFHAKQGLADIHQFGVYVYLNRGVTPELVEETAAHELSHVAMFDQGFAYPTLRHSYQTEWEPIVRALQSWTSDIIIDRRLLNYGYTNREYYDLLYTGTMENLRAFPEPMPHRMDQIGNALAYFYCHHSLPTQQWEDLRALYREVDPPVGELGEELIRLGDEMGFLGPVSYRRFLVAVRDHQELGAVIAIVDPQEKTTY